MAKQKLTIGGKSVEVDTSNTVEQLRFMMQKKNYMSAKQSFLDADGKDVADDAEETMTVADLVKDGVITVKGAGDKGKGGEKKSLMEAPLVKMPSGGSTVTTNLQSTTKDETGIPAINATATQSADYFQLMTDGQKANLFSTLQIERGIVVRRKGFEKTNNDVIQIAMDSVRTTYPNKTGLVDISVSYSLSIHDSVKYGSKEISGYVSTPFASASVRHNTEKESKKRTEKSTFYLLGIYDVVKVVFSVDRKYINPTEEFTEAVGNACDGQQNENYAKLLDVLEDFGHFTSREFVVGGRLWTEDVKESFDVTNEEHEKKEFGAAVKADLSSFGYPIGGGASYGQKSESKEGARETKQDRRLSYQSIGGDGALVADAGRFMGSVGPNLNWRVIEYRKPFPSLLLLRDQQLVGRAAGLLQKYCRYPTSPDNLPAIDVNAYAGAVIRALAPAVDD